MNDQQNGKGGGAGGSGNSDREPVDLTWYQFAIETNRYEYFDAQGNHAFFKIRLWNKIFREKRFSTKHQEIDYEEGGQPRGLVERNGYGDDGPLLYRLPQLLKAKPADKVFIPEGEKDCESLAPFGLIVTTNPDGALKWLDSYSVQLKALGITACLLYDNDAVGIKHTVKRAESLLKHEVPVMIVELPSLKDHGDVTDWLAGQALSPDKGKAAFMVFADSALRIENASDLQKWADTHKKDFTRKKSDHGDGDPLDTTSNIRLTLRKSDLEIGYDQFKTRHVIKGWEGKSGWVELDDHILLQLRISSEELYRLKVTKDRFNDVVMEAALRNKFHPVRDYFDMVQPLWDGQERNFLIDYGGVEDTAFNRKVGELMLIAAVRRIRSPGAKFDEMPVLESPEGMNKSSALEVLAVDPEWYTDESILNMGTKERMEILDGKLIVEVADLAGLRNVKDLAKLKSDLSRKRDRARMSYGRLAETHPRQGICVGTTNYDAYLRDPTGNRRIWPIKVAKFDLEALRRDIDQLWAEATNKEAVWKGDVRLPSELWPVAAEVQNERMIHDGWDETLAAKLGGLKGKIKAYEVWLLVGVPEERRHQNAAERLRHAMASVGWTKCKMRFGGPNPEWAYRNQHPDAGELRIVTVKQIGEGLNYGAEYEGDM